jgi:hypothetical protein
MQHYNGLNDQGGILSMMRDHGQQGRADSENWAGNDVATKTKTTMKNWSNDNWPSVESIGTQNNVEEGGYYLG